jgi:hypothetical protein
VKNKDPSKLFDPERVTLIAPPANPDNNNKWRNTYLKLLNSIKRYN